jgi:hypothetical protein
MSVLFRVVATLLIAVPAFLVLVIVFTLAGRRRTGNVVIGAELNEAGFLGRCRALHQ